MESKNSEISDQEKEASEEDGNEACEIEEDDDEEEGQESEDDLDFGELIEQNHLELVNHLDLERHFLFSYLRTKGILDNEDCERITNIGTTRQQKASLFLDTIKRRGPCGMKHFVEALKFEHPDLFKKITGKDAVSPPSCIMSRSWTGLAEKDFIDLDRTVLTKQLENTVKNFHVVTKMHQRVQEEKNILENKLFQSQNENRIHLEHIEELKRNIEKISDIKRLEEGSGLSSSEVQAHAQSLELAVQRELMQKTSFIIALQGKLLAQTEEIDSLKKINTQEKRRNDTLKNELKSLKIMFDEERRHSRRLNEQVQSQKGENNRGSLKKSGSCVNTNISDTCASNNDLQIQQACLREENENCRAELDEFRKYSEVLNAKYNMVSQENIKLSEHNELVVDSFQEAQEKIKQLCILCTVLQCDKDYLSKAHDRLLSDIITYREQQKTVYEELERTRADRDDAWKRMESANEELLRNKREHDEAIHSQMLLNRTFEQKYSDLCEDMDVMRDCFLQTNDELISTKKLLGESTLRRRTSNRNSLSKQQSDDSSSILTAGGRVNNEDNQDSNNGGIRTFGKRSNKDLLDSIRRKVSTSEENIISETSTPMTCTSFPSRSYPQFSYEQIMMLFSDFQVAPYPSVKSQKEGRSKSHNDVQALFIGTQPPNKVSVSDSSKKSLNSKPLVVEAYKSKTLPVSPTNFCKKENSSVSPSLAALQPSLTSITNFPSPGKRNMKNASAISMETSTTEKTKNSNGSKSATTSTNTNTTKSKRDCDSKRDSSVFLSSSPQLSSPLFEKSTEKQNTINLSSTEKHQSSTPSYVQTAIRMSPDLDYPPSYIHSTQMRVDYSRKSSASNMRKNTDTSNVYSKSISLTDMEHREEKAEGSTECFRGRSLLVTPEIKGEWKQKRSMSVPSSSQLLIGIQSSNLHL